MPSTMSQATRPMLVALLLVFCLAPSATALTSSRPTSSTAAQGVGKLTKATTSTTTATQWHLPHRLVSFGDVHGDLENALAILRQAQIVDCDGHWIAGPATVIQTGDVVDRGNHPHEIIEYFQQLKVEAARHGGEFIQLIGNHEIMNLRGDDKFVTPALLNAFGGESGWKYAFSTSGRYGKVLSELDTMVVRNNTVFVHAGLLPHFAEKSPVQTNELMRKVIREKNWGHEIVMNDGPVWTRLQIHQAMRGQCGLVHSALKQLTDANIRQGLSPSEATVTRIVVGHTIQMGGSINMFCNGSLIAQDIAISQYMQGGGHLGFVEFKYLPQYGHMVPLRFYPPVADLRHPLTKPRDPSTMGTADGSGANGGGLFDVNDLEEPEQPSSNSAQDGGVVPQLHRRKFRHQPPASLTHEDVSIAVVAFGVVIWRVVYAYQKRKAVGAHKKKDDVSPTNLAV